MNDVRATTLTADGTIFAGRARIKAVYAVCTGTAGSVVLKDGGSGGTTVLTLATPASATSVIDHELPGAGIICGTDVYLDLTNVTSVTVYYA